MKIKVRKRSLRNFKRFLQKWKLSDETEGFRIALKYIEKCKVLQLFINNTSLSKLKGVWVDCFKCRTLEQSYEAKAFSLVKSFIKS